MEQDAGNNIRFREVDQDGKPIEPASLELEESTDAGRPAWTSVNPFIVALWLVAAILLIGGVGVSANAASMMGPNPAVQPLAYILMSLAPWAVLAGLLNVLALLFWHAIEWQRKKGIPAQRTGA
ncbi:hypothetical protein [Pseudarthrobacter sp. DSP2-3-2b1]|uniref:hypothetical protein n=1 Tax=Pseudarthrobacter sp. DSP2-3-2b1 TaxID=2804661 RepID=UPI003CEB3E41